MGRKQTKNLVMVIYFLVDMSENTLKYCAYAVLYFPKCSIWKECVSLSTFSSASNCDQSHKAAQDCSLASWFHPALCAQG